MGRFSSVLLLTLAACGDNLIDEPPIVTADDSIEDATPIAPRYAPAVCDVYTWVPEVESSKSSEMTVSVVPLTRQAATVLATPKAGGALTGFRLDANQEVLDATTLAIDGTFTQGVASIVGDRLVSTAVEAGAVHVHLLDDDLGNPKYAATFPGTIVAQPAFYDVQADLVMPVAADDGLWLHRFQSSFDPIDSKLVVATKPVRSMAAAQMGVALLAAWSTDADCYLMLTSTFSPGVVAHRSKTCSDPRLAVNSATGQGLMVFNNPDGVHLMPIQQTQFGGATQLLRANTTSPRAVFDGSRFWISYLDERGDVLVGFLDERRKLVTMSLAGPKPEAGAYELVVVDGTPWVYSLGADGYSAHQMCVDTLD